MPITIVARVEGNRAPEKSEPPGGETGRARRRGDDVNDNGGERGIGRRVPEEVATQRNDDLIDDLLTDDFVEHGAFQQETQNREEIEEQIRSLLEAFPDFEAAVEDAVTEGDTVAMRVTLSGTHEGEFMGAEPTGRTFEVQNMVFTRIEDGRIAERWIQPDTLGMLQQLGVVESPTA